MKLILSIYLLTIALVSASPVLHAQSLSEQLKQESAVALIAAVREHGDAARGAVLFAEQRLACANCHGTGRTDLLGPDLSRLGQDVSAATLLEALLEPSKVIREGFGTVSVLTDSRADDYRQNH